MGEGEGGGRLQLTGTQLGHLHLCEKNERTCGKEAERKEEDDGRVLCWFRFTDFV